MAEVINHDLTGSENEEQKYKDRPARHFPVIEVFGPTIQGEGAMIGVRTMFVRFGGCDYRCVKCDSLHAVIPSAVKRNATMMTEEQIFEQLYEIYVKTGCDWVTLSGGNPVMWDITMLIDLLHGVGIKVAVETQGTLYRPWVAKCDQITVSPKSPGMGEKFEPQKFLEFLNRGIFETSGHGTNHSITCVKVPVFSAQDLEFCVGVQQLMDQSGFNEVTKYLSVGNAYPPALSAESVTIENPSTLSRGELPEQLLHDFRVLLEDYLQDGRLQDWRFTPQLHVLVWSNKAGV